MENRINETMSEPSAPLNERMLEELKSIVRRAEDKAKESAKAADKVVRDHPYPAVGLAFGLGLLIGVLAARRK